MKNPGSSAVSTSVSENQENDSAKKGKKREKNSGHYHVDTMWDGEVHLFKRIRNGKDSPEDLARATFYLRHYERGKHGRRGKNIIRCLYTNNLDIARDRANEWWKDYNSRAARGLSGTNVEFQELTRNFLQEKKRHVGRNLSESRYAQLKVAVNLLNQYVSQHRELGERAKLDSIDPNQDFDDYVIWRQEHKRHYTNTPIKRETIRADVKVLRQIWRWAIRHKHTDREMHSDLLKNDVESVNKALKINDEGRRGTLTSADYGRLYKRLGSKSFLEDQTPSRKQQGLGKGKPSERWSYYRHILRDFVLILANSGMRTKEAYNLRWEDVRFDGEHADIRIYNPKNARTRTTRGLQSAKYFRRVAEVTGCKEGTDYVFCALGNGTKQIYSQYLQQLFRDICDDLGLKDDLGHKVDLYTLRHMFITFRLNNGDDIWTVAAMVGTDVTNIERIYGSKPYEVLKKNFGKGKSWR